MSIVMPPPVPPSIQPESAQPMSRKEASAEAKAANARAKALRPWYRKKRFVLGLPILLVIVIAIASNANKSSNTPTAGKTVSGVTKGLGSNDASADVTDAVLGQPDTIGFRSVTLTVTNHSSKRSNYLINFSIESPDGTIQYDTSLGAVNNLEPGQTVKSDAFPITKAVPNGAVVKVKQVQRLAST